VRQPKAPLFDVFLIIPAGAEPVCHVVTRSGATLYHSIPLTGSDAMVKGELEWMRDRAGADPHRVRKVLREWQRNQGFMSVRLGPDDDEPTVMRPAV
jgi:hypothetical protein